MIIDATDFLQGIDRIKSAADDDIVKGLIAAVWQLRHNADNIVPKTPHDTGYLRGNKGGDAVVIAGKKVAETVFEATITYNAPYAHRWHECGPEGSTGEKEPAWSESGVGPLFLSKKLIDPGLQKQYREIIADIVRNGLK